MAKPTIYNGTTTVTFDSFDKFEQKLISEGIAPLSFQKSRGSMAYDPGFKIRYFTFWWVFKDDPSPPDYAYDKLEKLEAFWKAEGTKEYQAKVTWDRPDGIASLEVQGKILDIIPDPITYGKNLSNVTGKMNFVEDTILAQL